MKKYPKLFSKDDPARATAERLSSRVRDIVELASSCKLTETRREPGEKRIVTYHDPCHAARGQKLVAPPRQILRSLPGVEYRELPEANWCCGGAAAYALSHGDLSEKVLERKIDNVAKTGANVLATSCPACIIQLAYGVRKRGLPVRVCHISEIVSEGAK